MKFRFARGARCTNTSGGEWCDGWGSLALAFFLVAIVPAERASTADVNTRDGKLYVDGRPFFPFGFFANVGEPIRDLQAVGRNGFNTIHCNNSCDDAYYKIASDLHVLVIQEIWWTDPKISVESSRDRSPLIAYYVADDMNHDAGSCSKPKFTPREVSARSVQIRSYDRPPPSQHLTTGALVVAPECDVASYGDTVDILQGFNYPIGNWGASFTWLERNAQTVKMLVEAGGGRKPVFTDSQSFAWPGKRLPTPAESRNMNYAALALGVSGIMMYTISDPNGFFLPTAGPELWEELKTQAAEVRAMQDMLVEGQRTPLQVGPHIYAAAWTRDSRSLVIVVNTDPRETRTVTLRLPSNSDTTFAPAFNRYRSRVTVSGGILAGPMGAGEVLVLKGDEQATCGSIRNIDEVR